MTNEAKPSGNMETIEEDPRYAAAMLKIAFELRNQTGPQFEEIVSGILEGLDIAPTEFENFLEEYRDDLRKNCRQKGYV